LRRQREVDARARPLRDDQRFYAHSSARPDKSDWQTLVEHLTAVGDLAATFAAEFGAHMPAQAAGLLHDLGKYTLEFQERLEGGAKVDHATWGARIAVERFGPIGTLLAYGIAGHHAGLANGRSGDKRTSLVDRLAGCLPALSPAWTRELTLPEPSALWPIKGFTPCKERGMFQLSVLTRMLFSCLVDADFIDTDEFYRRIEGQPPRRGESPPSLTQLREHLDAKLDSFRGDTEVNRLRADILNHVRSQSARDPGLFSLTVPTGGGKTLASLAFALDHAIAHGLRRVIYVIPFTSIVEQNAQVFREAFGPLGDSAVLEHHSAFDDDAKTAWESKDKRRLAMENWDAPVVVTTAVQFFESLFADRPSRCRKLHHIAGSVVILDEAQTLPLKLLRPCVTLLDELALNYRTSVVLCTATQPALRQEDGFRNGFRNVRELAPEPPKLYDRLRRVGVRHIGTLDDDTLADHLRHRDQVLCIVNNRRHARAVYEAIADQPGARHLTTLMHARHRRKVLAEVRQRLRDGEPCRLVSTSLIEAGVDIDLPTVLRAEAGLDSIAQAAGRCNREGRRAREVSETLVFAPANPDWAPPPELKQFAQVFQSIYRRHEADLLAPEAVRAYFQELYWQKGSKELDAHDLIGLLKSSNLDSLPFETLAAKFRMIETAMRPVIVPFDPDTRAIDPDAAQALRDLEYASGMARRLQPFLVQVPQKAFDALRQAGAIQPVAPERYAEQFMQLVNPDLYDKRFGLHWDNPAFVSSEKMIW
jgi:CRISPR-associated endonuclease/helicase Cas3